MPFMLCNRKIQPNVRGPVSGQINFKLIKEESIWLTLIDTRDILHYVLTFKTHCKSVFDLLEPS